MKVLRIYDHLGELKKELNLFVEGEDFKWTASYPEPVWLGTITLEDVGKEPEPVEKFTPVEEPITEEEAQEMEEEVIRDAALEAKMAEELQQEAEVEPLAPFTTQSNTTEELTEEEELEQAPFLQAIEESIGAESVEEVENEPKKVHRKRSRKSRTHPSDYLKSLKVIRQDDSGANVTEGD